MTKTLLIFHMFLLSCAMAFAQAQEYNINMSINGLRDTTVFLGYYNGESTLVKDTARVNNTGHFRFDGKGPLAQGIYFLAIGKPRVTRLFEFVIGQTQKFSISTDTTDYIGNMRISGDIDNQLFLENMIFNGERNKEAEPFVKVMRDSASTEEQKASATKRLQSINERVLEHQQNLIRKHPKTITARILEAGQPVKIPEPPKRNDGSIDANFQLKWYRQHFFDNFDLSDEVLLRLPRPVYKERIYEYLDKLWAPQADTLINALEFILSKAKHNPETYKYAVLQAVFKFQSPEIMGLDKVFVHINDTYFATGQMDYWANAQMKKNMSDHANRLRKSLIGQKAANLIMQDINFKPRSLYDIQNKYTVIYFFDPGCSACKKETPKLVEFYNKRKFDLQVYAVSADSSMVKMRDYIKEMGMKWITVNGPRTYVGSYHDLYDASTTPTLYVLNKEKEIIAKRVPAEKLGEFLIQYERVQGNRVR